jgi:hypothetical protein
LQLHRIAGSGAVQFWWALSAVRRISREAAVADDLQGSFDCAAASHSRSIGCAQDDSAELMIAYRERGGNHPQSRQPEV